MSPNPFYLRNNNEKITFYKVSEGVSIKIYQIDGRLIKKLSYRWDNKIKWDIRDKNRRESSSIRDL